MVRQQQFFSYKQSECKFYHFMDYQLSKPFFKNPIQITVGDPLNETLFMVKNVVYKEKQILALKRNEELNTVLLVEAKIENGQLNYISMLPDDLVVEISKILEDRIH
jgi:hypothetical protein